MVKSLRHIKIKEILTEKGAVDVHSLAQQLQTSAVTIRNDLAHLEQEGFLIRTYGGAVLSASAPQAPHYAAANEPLEIVGQLAARYVRPNGIIMLGFGRTCRAMAHYLLGMDVLVVSGNLDAIMYLASSPKPQVFVPGGYLARKHDYLFTCGEWYQKALSNLSIDQSFISVAGIDSSGFTLDSASECSTLELLRSISKEVILVSDSQKFDSTSFFRISNFSFADTIITDSGVPEIYRSICKEYGVKLITPDRESR